MFSDDLSELEVSGSSRRRQSEPPIALASLHSDRDDSYIRAIFKFNEWRSRHRFTSFGCMHKNPGKQQSRNTVNTSCENKSETTLSSVEQDNGIYEEISPKNPIGGKAAQRKENSRFARSFSMRDKTRNNKNNCCKAENKHISSYVIETEEAEKEDWIQMEEQLSPDSSENISTPPQHFFRENSHPFRNVRSPEQISQINREKNCCNVDCTNLGKNSKYFRKNKKTKVHHHCKKSEHSLPDVLSTEQQYKNKNRSPRETILNFNGEEVEYSLPYCEMDESFDRNLKNKFFLPGTSSTKEDLRTKDEKNSDLVHVGFVEFGSDVKLQSSPAEQIYDPIRPVKVLVTDLDKSNDTTKNVTDISKDSILEELSVLENWGKHINMEDNKRKSLNYSQDELLGSEPVITCRDGNETPSVGITEFQRLPIVLSLEKFRNVPVSKYYINYSEKDLAKKAVEHNFLIMRKIRHPNISLLMATINDDSNKIKSLVLEPFRCTLHQLLYVSEIKLGLLNCVDYIMQIGNAASYLQASGLIHSNISSHSVFVCQYTNQVKLSSFELTTFVNNRVKDEIVSLYNKDKIIDLRRLSSKHLPYCKKYRQKFSQYFYQAPELITSDKSFVFPTNRSDVYGVTLTLWEMLNCKIPYGIFNYSELKNLFYLKKAHLPNFEADRCRHFEDILRNGLETRPKDRTPSVELLYDLVAKVKAEIICDNEKRTANENTENHKKSNNIILDETISSIAITDAKTSTAKKIKNQRNTDYLINRRKLFTSEEKPSDQVDKGSKSYQFKIDEMSLPQTPIARKNKIRRAVWLSNNNDIPIKHSTPEKLELNTSSQKDEQQSPLRKLNVNITIMQNGSTAEISPGLSAEKSPRKIHSHIKFWNSMSSSRNDSDKIQLEDSSKLSSIREASVADQEVHNEQVSERDDAVIIEDTEKFKHLEQTGSATKETSGDGSSKKSYYPGMPELLSETFHKKNRPDAFESVLWKREKEKCESSPREIEKDGVITPKKTSVKETVNKFEEICNAVHNPKIGKKCTAPQGRKVSNEAISQHDEVITLIKITEQQNCKGKVLTSVPNAKCSERITDSERLLNKVVYETESDTAKEQSVSKLDVLLRNNVVCKNSNVNTNLEVNDTHSMLEQPKAKELIRCSSEAAFKEKVEVTKSVQTYRHSIGGPEIQTREKIMLLSNRIHFHEFPPMPQIRTKNEVFVINSNFNQCREVTCRECGSHNVFYAVGSHLHLPFNYQTSELRTEAGNSTRRLVSNDKEKLASMEELYIDDDFQQGTKLAANMKLSCMPESPEPQKDFHVSTLNLSSLSLDYLKSHESLAEHSDESHNQHH